MTAQPSTPALRTPTRRGLRPDIPISRLPQPDEAHMRSTWKQCKPRRIARALELSQAIDSGGWYVIGGHGDVGTTSIVRTVSGVEVVLWRGEDGTLHAGPGACPHLGAALSDCVVNGQSIYCRWHGMELPDEAGASWKEFAAYDDGVLLWVQLPTLGEEPRERPLLPARPPLDESIAAVIHVSAVCEPRDIIANRLDPWHGAWFHPYAFSHLRVNDAASTDERLVVDVAFRLNKTWGVPVVATFTTPDARTIVMHIVEGEGEGSVVETHATPLGVDRDRRQRTMMTEATIAHSARPGFRVAHALRPLIRPLINHTARRLWVDDLAYAERRYAIR